MLPTRPSLRSHSRLFSTHRTTGAKKSSNSNSHIKNKKVTDIKALSRKHAPVPSHPYPARTTYKQSNYGLYGGTHIQYGNNVTGEFRAKSRRFWRPNIQTKRLWSEGLAKYIRVRVQARVLRTIDKVGGLDEYLLGEKAQRIKELGVGGWALRWSLIRTPTVQERWRQEKERLGVPQMKMKARLRLRDQLQNL
ncbi:39S ribosomal protein L24, mitochondrial [Pseudocyphellaria aurata]|nr:39S ribosomal protein L24, mitochondrial [Pseudocyphellaria aurata]